MKHISLAEYWKSKYEGQLARCKDLTIVLEIKNERIEGQKKALHSIQCKYNDKKHQIETLKAKEL